MKKSCKKQVGGRIVRVIFTDPYATDDSSGDEWFDEPKPPKVKRIVHEINLPFQNSQYRCGGVRKCRRKASNKPVGVRLRRSGKWAAEIRNPLTKTKVWLGTYETPEEAGKAYADKKVEFDACASSRTASGPCPNGDNDLSLSKDAAASGDSTTEDFDFSKLDIPDLSFLAAKGESTVSGLNAAEMDFDWFLKEEDSCHLFDEFSLLDNVNNIGVGSELPDCDFTDVEREHGDMKFAFADQLAPPLNIACP